MFLKLLHILNLVYYFVMYNIYCIAYLEINRSTPCIQLMYLEQNGSFLHLQNISKVQRYFLTCQKKSFGLLHIVLHQ